MHPIGCVCSSFLVQLGLRSADEQRLIACIVPRVRFSTCISPLLHVALEMPNARNDIFAESDSVHATVSLTKDVLVYN
jgi:hypothetical protein